MRYSYQRYGNTYTGELTDQEIKEYLEKKEMVNIILIKNDYGS